VSLDDIPGLEADLDGIRFTADGKNRVYVQTDSPGENLASNGSFEDGTETRYLVRRNLATVAEPAGLGSVTVVKYPVWDGDQWLGQVTANTAGHGVRLSMNSLTAEIPNGSTLYVAWEVGNPGAIPVTVSVDSADGNTVSKTLAPGERAIVETSYSRADYTTVYRFTDLTVMQTGAPVVYRNVVADTAPLVGYGNGDVSLDSDLTPSWAGTPGASVSLFSAPLPVGYLGSASVAVQSGQWAKTGSKSMRIVSKWATRGSAYVDLANHTTPGLAPGDVVTTFVTARRDRVHPFSQSAYISAALVPGATSEYAPNEPGEHPLRLTFTVPAGSWYLRLYNGGQIGDPDIWFDDLVVMKGDVEKPFTQGDLWLQLDPTGESVIAVKVWSGAAWAPQVLYADSIVAAGSITAPLIRAGEIQVNHVSPSFGDDLNLSANESVTIIVGQQADQATQIADLDAGVSDAQTAANDAAGAAGPAQAAADSAAAQAAGAASAASDVGQRLDIHQLYFKVEGDSAKIGRPNGSAELRLAPERIEFTQNDVPGAWLEASAFFAPELRSYSAQIGNHQFMTYGAGRTIVRPL
jgi:hypothetical protein